MSKTNELDIYELFRTGLTNRASAQTAKYFIGDSSFEKDANNVIYTFLTIRSKGRNNAKITVDDEEYSVNEYGFSPNMNLLIAAAKVYATKDSIGYNDEYHVASAPESKDGVELYSPAKVKGFFNRYNSNQSDDKIDIQPVQFKEVTLLDFCALKLKNESKYIKFVDGGAYGENVALLNGVECPLEAKYVSAYKASNSEVMASWLLS